MQRRILSILLGICLVCTAVPLQSMAAEDAQIADLSDMNPPNEDLSDIEQTDSDFPDAELPDMEQKPEQEFETEQESGTEQEPAYEQELETEQEAGSEPEEDTATVQNADDELAGSDEEITDLETELPEELGGPAGYIPIEEEDDTPSVQDEAGIVAFARLPAAYIPDISDLSVVRRQAYGNCWAFSGMFMAESSMAKQQNVKNEDYSELHLTYFSYHTPEDPLEGTTGDINACRDKDFLRQGGNLQLAEKILAGWIGAADESLAPNENSEKALTEGLNPVIACQDEAHLQYAYHVNLEEDQEAAKALLQEYGGIGVSYYSSGASDYYNPEYNSYYCPEDITEDHAVTIVGWDDRFPAKRFGTLPGDTKIPEGNGAWLVRNSWGVNDYSYNGYFWLSYYDKSLSRTAYSFVFENVDNYDYNYQYDGSMASKSIGYKTDTVMIANVFKTRASEKGELLKAVAFQTYNANVNYTIQVYKNPVSALDPQSGTLVESATMEGCTSYQGYYTVPLENEVPLVRGDTFAVVITLSKPGENVSFVAEASSDSWYVCTANAAVGQSFCKSSPEKRWTDYGKTYNGNIRVKAFTDDGIPLEGISIKRASYDLTYGRSMALNVTYQPINTTDRQKIVWSSDNEKVAVVDNLGTVKAAACGEAHITAQAGEFQSTTTIRVVPGEKAELEPILVNKSITINKYSLLGAEIDLRTMGGNEIVDVSVDSEQFEIVQDKEKSQSWRLCLKSDAREQVQKRTTVQQTLKIRTAAGGTYVYEKPVRITVDVKKPAVSLKNTQKLNVFYTDSTAGYE